MWAICGHRIRQRLGQIKERLSRNPDPIAFCQTVLGRYLPNRSVFRQIPQPFQRVYLLSSSEHIIVKVIPSAMFVKL